MQHRRQPHPPVAPHHLDAAPDAVTPHAPHRDRSTSASRSVHFSPADPTSRHARQARGAKTTYRTPEPSANSRPAAARPISTRNTTDLAAEMNRSRRGVRPISSRNSTDFDAEYDRSRRRRGDAASMRGHEGRRRRRPATRVVTGRRSRLHHAAPTANERCATGSGVRTLAVVGAALGACTTLTTALAHDCLLVDGPPHEGA